MKEEIDNVLKGMGDLLLQLGCDTGWLVPNTSMNSKQLNASITSYQLLLDSMELEITSASAKAAQRNVPEVKEEESKEAAAGSPALNPEEGLSHQNLSIDDINVGYGDDLGNQLGDEIDLYSINRPEELGMFSDMGVTKDDLDTGKLPGDDYDLIDDQYF